jgi:phage terminase small subunit
MARGGYRPNSGPQKGAKYNTKGSKKDTKTGIPGDIIADAKAENMDPLTYMLKVMNDPMVDDARKDRMAIAAAPFVHSRKGDGQGKKEGKADRAANAGKGKFKSSAPPELKVVKK